MLQGWLRTDFFRHSMVILNLNDHQMEKWRRDDRDENPPSPAHFLRNDQGVTRFVIPMSFLHSRMRMNEMTLTTFQLGNEKMWHYWSPYDSITFAQFDPIFGFRTHQKSMPFIHFGHLRLCLITSLFIFWIFVGFLLDFFLILLVLRKNLPLAS